MDLSPDQERTQVAQRLRSLLEAQVKAFDMARLLQEGINKKLKINKDLPEVLEQLQLKEQMLDQIRTRTTECQPQIATWMQCRDQWQGTPEHTTILNILDRLDQVVAALRIQDEEMLQIVQKREDPPDPNLLIHAFRALS
jgi:hypothetical protein